MESVVARRAWTRLHNERMWSGPDISPGTHFFKGKVCQYVSKSFSMLAKFLNFGTTVTNGGHCRYPDGGRFLVLSVTMFFSFTPPVAGRGRCFSGGDSSLVLRLYWICSFQSMVQSLYLLPKRRFDCTLRYIYNIIAKPHCRTLQKSCFERPQCHGRRKVGNSDR